MARDPDEAGWADRHTSERGFQSADIAIAGDVQVDWRGDHVRTGNRTDAIEV